MIYSNECDNNQIVKKDKNEPKPNGIIHAGEYDYRLIPGEPIDDMEITGAYHVPKCWKWPGKKIDPPKYHGIFYTSDIFIPFYFIFYKHCPESHMEHGASNPQRHGPGHSP